MAIARAKDFVGDSFYWTKCLVEILKAFQRRTLFFWSHCS